MIALKTEILRLVSMLRFCTILFPILFSSLLYSQSLIDNPCSLTAGSQWSLNSGCISVSTAGFTHLFDPGSCNSGSFNDGWAWFTGDGSGITINFNADPGVDPIIHVFSASAPCTVVEIDCADNTLGGGTETATFTSVLGQNYFIRLQNLNSNTALTGCLEVLSATLLPIELTYFDAQWEKDRVFLHWETAIEINNSSFILERSLDANNWQVLQHLKGFGNSSQPVFYSTYDTNPHQVNYYRLKQVDFNGQFKTSSIIRIERPNLKSPPAVYPNPVVDEMTISGSSEFLEGLVIYNSAGSNMTPVAKLKTNLMINGTMILAMFRRVYTLLDHLSHLVKSLSL